MRTGQVCVYFAKITKLLVNVLGSNVVPRDVGFVASHPCQCLVSSVFQILAVPIGMFGYLIVLIAFPW